ncbi:hypothetical protein C0989_001793 [Termitomyces sp. Mn162]|nr:hypothetical protein C0989_001793 [Termitomyces sp. Mn162]
MPTTAICVGSVPEVLGLGGILSVEVPEFVGGSVEVLLGFPHVILRSIALLADQVLESAVDYPGVEDLVDLAEVLVVKFDGRPPGLEISLVKPNQGAGGPVRGRLVMGIGMLGVGLVGGVDLIPEELVEGLEVLSNLVGNMGRDVLEGQHESGIVALVGIKEGNSSGGVRHVVVGEFGKGKLRVPVVL